MAEINLGGAVCSPYSSLYQLRLSNYNLAIRFNSALQNRPRLLRTPRLGQLPITPENVDALYDDVSKLLFHVYPLNKSICVINSEISAILKEVCEKFRLP